jgi:predicted NUDIX family NTP pyrophosphohydrolase
MIQSRERDGLRIIVAVRHSAGLLLYHRREDTIEVLIAHMGGPFWAGKDEHAWSIPKGEHESGEDSLQAARREFSEELGLEVPAGEPFALGSVKQASEKIVSVWALEADLDVPEIHGDTFELQWPRGSGQIACFPEVDRAGWFDIDTAAVKLVRGQVAFLDLLVQHARHV